MKIIKRDLEYIVELLNRFELTRPDDSFTMEFEETNLGYELHVKFTKVIHGVICEVRAEIFEDMFDE
jgi:hypothetical protein